MSSERMLKCTEDMSDMEELETKKPSRSVCPFRTCLSCVGTFIIAVIILCTAVLIWMVATQPELTPVITIVDGRIQGNVQFSRDGKQYWEFLGIRYAMPPTGSRKFMPPVEMEPWESVKQVTSQPPSCIQRDALLTTRVFGEMDCLFLNVFVNVEQEKNNVSKPVLVFLHGGGFISGAAKLYRPDYFMDQDIVLVVINYRLGPFGFLNLQDNSSVRGNFGLLDQNLAFKWIQRNIEHFGGDPRKVTLFGESAGAASVHYHLMSSKSKGLFHRAILMSGTGLAPWAFSKKPREIAEDYKRRIGCSSENTFACFNATDPKLLVKHQNSLLNPVQKKDIFEPTVDGEFLEKLPIEYLESGEFSTVPVMFGVNAGEGGIRTGRFELMPELVETLEQNWYNLSSHVLILDDALSEDNAREIRSKYFRNATFSSDFQGFLNNVTHLMSDAGFFYPLHKSAVLHAKYGAPTYLYYFNYTSNIYPGLYNVFRSISADGWLPSEVYMYWTIVKDWLAEHVFELIGSHKYGVSHGEDLFQLWNCDGITRWLSSYDANFSRSFIQVLVDFSNATTTSPLKFRGVTWPSINSHLSSGKNEYASPFMLMNNDANPTTVPEPFGRKLNFWRELAKWDYN